MIKGNIRLNSVMGRTRTMSLKPNWSLSKMLPIPKRAVFTQVNG